VERLARILGLNKSGFYHYFGTADIYYQHLIVHHHEMIDLLCKDIDSIQSLDPDYLHVMIKHRVTIMANMQLTRNRHIKIFEKALDDANSKVDRLLLPLWADYSGLTEQPELALRFLAMVRDAFYARVTAAQLTFEVVESYFSEVKSMIREMAMGDQSKRPAVFMGSSFV